MGEQNAGSTWKPRNEIAMCSGTIAADDTVVTIHGSANVANITADSAAGTLTMTFGSPFDTNDNVYFALGFVFGVNGNPQAFLPTGFSEISVTLTAAGGPYPGDAPWTFAFLAITTPEGGAS